MYPASCQALDDYLAHDLSEAERSRFEAHLPLCPECREAVAENRRLDGLLGEALTRLRPAPAALPERVRLRLDRARRNRRVGVGAALAASLLALGVGLSTLHVATPPAPKEVVKGHEPPAPKIEPAVPRAHAQVRFADGSGTIAVPVATESADFTFIRVYKGLRDVAGASTSEASAAGERSDP